MSIDKKLSDIKDSLTYLYDGVSILDSNIHTNPDIFDDVKKYRQCIADTEKLSTVLSRDLKKDLISDLRNLSSKLQGDLLSVYEQCIEQYVDNHILWYFLGKLYVNSSTPEDFAALCKNTENLSYEEKMSLAIQLVDDIMFTVVKDILEDVSDREDDRKIQLIKDTRTKYPNASNKVNHLLTSKNKRNAIKQGFLISTKNAFVTMLQEESSEIFDGDFHDFMNFLSLFIFSFANEDQVDLVFSKYVSLFLEEQFQKSDHKNNSKVEQKQITTQGMLSSALLSVQEPSTPLQALPHGLKDDINTYLLTKKINGNCTKLLDAIEKILQKFLTRKDSIRKPWLKEKILSSFGIDCIDDSFFVLLETYGFSCIDVSKGTTDDSSDIDDICSGEDVSLNKEPLSDEKNTLLTLLKTYDVDRGEGENKKAYLTKKLSGYASVFEKLGYVFENKQKFIESAADYCYSNTRLDKDIKRVVYDIIVKNKQEQKKIGRNYYTFEMSNGRRIMLYNKGVISALGPHDYYEKHLKNNY